MTKPVYKWPSYYLERLKEDMPDLSKEERQIAKKCIALIDDCLTERLQLSKGKLPPDHVKKGDDYLKQAADLFHTISIYEIK